MSKHTHRCKKYGKKSHNIEEWLFAGSTIVGVTYFVLMSLPIFYIAYITVMIRKSLNIKSENRNVI